MKDRRKKTKPTPEQRFGPLPPEAATRLEAQVAQVRELLASGEDLEDLEVLATPDPDDLLWDLHLIQALAKLKHAAIPRLLASLFGKARDKERRKALKRALHLLKTGGVQVPDDLLPEEEGGLLPPSPAARAFVSPSFADGERFVILEGPREFLGGNTLAVRLSDTAGIRECHLLSLKRKHREELWENFRQQDLSEFAAVPPAYAVRLLENAFDLDPASEPAADYAPLRTALWQHWGVPEEAAELQGRLPQFSESERRAHLERSLDLARHPLFLDWLPSPEAIAPWVTKIQAVQESPLILAEHQQRDRFDQVVEEAARSLYPPETRRLLSRRLLDMAYFLDLTERPEEARAAQAAGEALAAGETGPLEAENPFLRGLVIYAVLLALEHARQSEPAKTPSGLVTLPDDSLIIRG
jgi:hypothetical protein